MDPLQIRKELWQLNSRMLEAEKQHQPLLEKVHPAQYKSACNLLHYLALRSLDIRDLQDALHEQGLSSLASSESHIRSQVLAVLRHFGVEGGQAACNYHGSKQLLQQRAAGLFGPCSQSSIPCIMVTFESSYAQDHLTVKRLVRSGMNIARINCAHDDPDTWLDMIKHVKKASEFSGIPCKIYMDLAGPKIRTSINGVKKGRLLLEEGDSFYLADNEDMRHDPPVVGCTLPGIAVQLKPGERILFDDGVIEAKVTEVKNGAALLEVVRISSKKPYLKTGKGINIPNLPLSLPALTPFDRECLPFILEHADLVGYSFVHNTADLMELQEEMKDKKRPVILKIETPEAVKNLPGLLLHAMQDELFGVMIARGDLAVEVGFERISEVQEELLWICEAAHAPVIWATQVLENLNKMGLATRSEVTDAAHGIMAECILVNKGPNIVRVIETLKDILTRSGAHHAKKRFLFRPLSIAARFMMERGPGMDDR